jgi:hypothetical protein
MNKAEIQKEIKRLQAVYDDGVKQGSNPLDDMAIRLLHRINDLQGELLKRMMKKPVKRVSKEERAMQIATLVFRGFSLAEAKAMVRSRNK